MRASRTGVDERALADISKLVEVFSGRRVPANKPISGENVFTQTAGIHADGDMKGNLYESRLTPGAVRSAPHLRDGQADGEGEPRLQPRAPEHHADAGAEAAAAGAHRRAGRSEEERDHLRPAVSDFRSAADAGSARVRGEGLFRRQQSRIAAHGHRADPVSRQGNSRHRVGRRRLRRVHAGAEEHREAAGVRAAAPARLRGPHPARRQDRRPGGDHHQVGRRHEDTRRAQRSAGRRDSGHRTRAEHDCATYRERVPGVLP